MSARLLLEAGTLPPPERMWLSVSEAASVLGVSTSTASRHAHAAGVVRHVGRRLLIWRAWAVSASELPPAAQSANQNQNATSSALPGNDEMAFQKGTR